MTLLKLTFFFSVSLILSTNAFAAKNAPDAVCWKTYNAYDAIADCQKEILQDAKDDLNKTYKAIEDKNRQPDQIEYIKHLEIAQKAWLNYRFQECIGHQEPDPDEQFKVGEDPSSLSCLIDLTLQRTTLS